MHKLMGLDVSNRETKMRLWYAWVGFAVFCLAAHGYAYFNFMPRHDMFNYLDRFAGGLEITTGRFFQVMYGKLWRGTFTMPWMHGMLTMIYGGLAAFLVCEVLEVKNRWAVLFSAGLLAANASMTDITLSFIYILDAYVLGMLLAVAGAFVVIRRPNVWGVLAGGLLMSLGMGIYQSQMLFGPMLMVIHAMRQSVRERSLWKAEWRRWLCYVAALAVTAALYYAFYALFLNLWGLSAAETYNTPANMGRYSIAGLLSYVKHAYSSFAAFFFGYNQGYLSLFYLGNIVLFGAVGIGLLWRIVRRKLPVFNVLVLAAGAVLFPLGAQVMSVLLYSETTAFMVSHSLFLMYPAALKLLDGLADLDGRMFARRALCALCAVLLFASARFSNEVYAFQSIQYEKTISQATRIMDEIDRTPGYEDDTEIVCVGTLYYNLENMNQPEAFRWMREFNGMAATTYTQTFRQCMYMLGEWKNVLIDNPKRLDEFAAMEEVQQMPCYPKPGYCQMVGDSLVVKFGKW